VKVQSKFGIAVILAAFALTFTVAGAQAQPGTSLGFVTLPGNGACSVAGSFDGTYYITVNTNACQGSVLGIYKPPPTGTGPATLVSTKAVVDASNNPVTISAVDWDSSRNMLWGVIGSTGGKAYLIDLGDKTLSGTAVATLQFNYSIPGFALVDGLAWDFFDDTVWISPDVSCCVYHFSPSGTSLGSITVKNAAGQADGSVSGVAIGANNSLYVGRDGTGEIRRVSKSNGNFVSSFTTTNFRVEDLTCDATTYAPKEAILAKDAFGSAYEAFEVEPGTCPEVPPVGPGPPFNLDLQPPEATNPVGTQHCLTATVTDESGQPVPDINVVFDTEGASEIDQNPPDEDGSATTNDQGVAKFCYTGPDLPGKDVIKAFADTNGNGIQDAPPPAGDEPFDTADKLWVLPVSTPGCEVKITNGGWITALNGDTGSFGGNAKVDAAGVVSGNEEYQDHGPVFPMNLHGNVLVVICESATAATIYGSATIDGAGSHFYRIRVQDNHEPGTGFDKYGIIADNGYASGDQTLEGGNVQVHKS
jgi:hypothetical protein